MSKRTFILGIALGAIAGVAAKLIYDNKEEVKEFAMNNYYLAKDELASFVDHASDKVEKVSEDFVQKAEEYKNYAKEQYEGIKEIIKDISLDEDEEYEEELDSQN